MLGAGWWGGTRGSPDLSAPPESQGLIPPAGESLAVHRIRPPSKWGIHPEISRKHRESAANSTPKSQQFTNFNQQLDIFMGSEGMEGYYDRTREVGLD